ncbi:tetratricopeptide repeat protein [Candidatus Poribacteria bacterium]|nr:tetratricopeptide repeat protein [Candidatus Poribacteria bacterium]
MPVVVWDYLRILIAPIHLCADYVVGLRHDLTAMVLVAIESLLILCGGIGVLIIKRRPGGFFAAWVFLSLLPVLQIIPISVMKAERFLYLPSVGFCALAGLLGACIYARTAGSASGGETHTRPRLCILAFVMIVLALSFRTIKRNTAWKDEFTLYRVTASCAPGNFRVQYNLGNAYFRRGDIANALAHTETAFRLRPDFPQVSYNLGLMYATVGRLGEAEAMYRKAIESDPAYARAHNNLAAILFSRGRLEEAGSEWSRALALDPGMEQAKEGLRLLDQSGR